ncbi:DNA repair protein RecN [Helcococcus ovis]|uniref:DNA repair protein RecN n=1 Tax=Helcococcus ovis TaxID=72026 RepID=A0A4R9C2U2_9FIRM|nr:DNA repair protein RecN [Helcococcus ovis]TFF64918.1 DNA repair protein RecN [Helcococcus ovis]TFF65413.1 DNA repair protein RecN [Helcococcus ovis]
MLLNLYVKNFAIIKQINISFDNGLNILSGETGAGKSLLLKALSLIKGERFSKDYIGKFDQKTIVEVVFTSNDNINNLLLENNIDIDDNIILTRIFDRNASVTKINNRACSVKFMSQIANVLFDIHGQHSQLVVLDKSNYISLIDKFDKTTNILKISLSENLKTLNKLKSEISNLEIPEDELEREKDLLKYQINEIESFNFNEYDEEKLNKEYKKLTNQTELINGTNAIIDAVSQSNKSLSVKEIINMLYDKLLDLERLDSDLKDLTSDILNIKELIYDFSRNIENYSYTLDIDEERIQVIEDIFSAFQVLRLKYGKTPDEILEFLENIKSRFKILSNIEKRRNELALEISKINNENKKIADDLTNKRIKIIKELEDKIIKELSEMNMLNIDFKIQLNKLEKISKNGHDDIDFMISTNKGQELKSLSNVSSGGEISRFMLALKAALIDKEDLETIIFDEIDTGISGKTADIVGNKLKKISKVCQLIVISHLAQIASKSDTHYLIYKDVENDFTITNIQKLDYDGKVKEIARLISGIDITKNSMDAANELLKESL